MPGSMTSRTTRSTGRSSRDRVERRLAGVDDVGVVAFGFEIEPQAVGEVLLVFDDEDAAHAGGSARGSWSGERAAAARAPSLSAKTLPPCLRATERTMKRPRPVPLTRIADGLRDAVEAPEDPLQLGGGDADALVAHADGDAALVHGGSSSTATRTPSPEYLIALSSRFETRRLQLVGIAEHRRLSRTVARRSEYVERLGLEVMPHARQLEALAHQCRAGRRGTWWSTTRLRAACVPPAAPARSSWSSRSRVVEHHAVELAPLLLRQLAALQRLQVQPDRRDRRLELVGDGVDERVVLLVAPDLAHQEDRIEDEARDDEREQDDAEAEQQAFAPVDDDPADVQRDGDRDQADAERR